ncbi:hypothetical protein SAMN04488543_4070 [Friedmanniella luteola]|uniref:Uncharacterized protein n=1 Tax=Friedmanniella luteola TaxID=546871 RepID=A0A1H1ZYJ2_9ACTN|nr:hypothetical protein [Friedmanniella luteola]SDT38326.1 hypothetical protein SAMN04488543_4070 [Friedmanniella luteola]
MVDSYQMVLGAVAVTVMVLVPILCVLCYDLLAGRWDESVAAWRERRAVRREHRRAVKALREQQGLPLEQVIADLRRLRVVVGDDAGRSAAHQMGNRLAYDRLLAQTCDMLEVHHDLGTECLGMEREIERLRVEAELERVGVRVTDRRFGQAA